MIKVLKNPLTSNYTNLKEHILSQNFPWRYRISTNSYNSNSDGHTHMEYYLSLIHI